MINISKKQEIESKLRFFYHQSLGVFYMGHNGHSDRDVLDGLREMEETLTELQELSNNLPEGYLLDNVKNVIDDVGDIIGNGGDRIRDVLDIQKRRTVGWDRKTKYFCPELRTLGLKKRYSPPRPDFI